MQQPVSWYICWWACRVVHVGLTWTFTEHWRLWVQVSNSLMSLQKLWPCQHSLVTAHMHGRGAQPRNSRLILPGQHWLLLQWMGGKLLVYNPNSNLNSNHIYKIRYLSGSALYFQEWAPSECPRKVIRILYRAFPKHFMSICDQSF